MKISATRRIVSAASAMCVSLSVLSWVTTLATPHQSTAGITTILAQAQTAADRK